MRRRAAAGAGHLPAEGFDGLRGLLARHLGQRAGQHERLAGQRAWTGGRRGSLPWRRLDVDAGAGKALEEIAVMGLVEPLPNRRGDHRPDLVDRLELTGIGVADRGETSEGTREDHCRALAHVTDSE